ncbi:hypothetical protein CYMTET_4263 [Cymbomonas tetramitiformis]|uniref:Uncharacterized protein n=1 Tax=Cymbomonas tetramitiformis TaxID=36881 RepID=A0AAE0H1J6_9CHLO|nr:hypothetical protein CYMTET_4263 [Cymbomonas tetramitiformis]
MEALPIFLDKLVPEFAAIIISVTMVLIFGEVLPQAVCSRNGLAIGANLSFLVRILSFVCYPLAKPIAKVLDVVLGEAEKEELRRAELKELVKLQSMAEGGKLVVDEVTIIHGALDMKEKTVGQVMQPIEKVFMLERNQVYDEALVRELLGQGHSRVPVYSETKDKIMGQILVKNLLGVSTNGSVRVKDLPLRQVHAVDVGKPLYDALNLFQRGKSHLAVVRNQSEVVGIATLEDIMEELIQEEIVDETDVYVDVNTQERVASRADSSNNSSSDDAATSGQFREISRRRNSLTMSGLRPGLSGALSPQIIPSQSATIMDSRRLPGPSQLGRARSMTSRDWDQTFPVLSQSVYSPQGSQTDLATPLLDET